MHRIKDKPVKLLIPHEKVQERIKELAREIEDYFREPFLVVGLLKGAFVFLADLIREIQLPVKVDFIWASSYGSSTESSQHVKIVKDLDMDVSGQRILLVDDILDTGYTLKEIKELLLLKGAKEVKTCVLLDKKERRKIDVEADFVGFDIPNYFIVGYGLDWDEEGRNLKGVYAVEDA
ncbi:hypoxanthine phosphoribosyltransferase [Thermocrinis minervae]|uniref:Hypoxanthine phosphoribosyltransferase n=1 Tax=Thermocrinis minervae TaxID=381751 RepID=A0A1M6S678_9AQUI|nr:hypoxanthine phosphoribosyltransferase [Thermocrinis minervae]SHK40292.1 hypoxanthine phosphoribosyltransferase [Thermocrinis minervae]